MTASVRSERADRREEQRQGSKRGHRHDRKPARGQPFADRRIERHGLLDRHRAVECGHLSLEGSHEGERIAASAEQDAQSLRRFLPVGSVRHRFGVRPGEIVAHVADDADHRHQVAAQANAGTEPAERSPNASSSEAPSRRGAGRDGLSVRAVIRAF